MPIIEDLARALAWTAHEAVHLAMHYTGEPVTQVESEIEKGFDEVDIGGESADDEDE